MPIMRCAEYSVPPPPPPPPMNQYTKGGGDPAQMVSVRKRNIQGRYNSVRHLQRRYLELPPLRVVSIVDSIVTNSVPISLENTRTRLRLYI